MFVIQKHVLFPQQRNHVCKIKICVVSPAQDANGAFEAEYKIAIIDTLLIFTPETPISIQFILNGRPV